MFRFRAEVLRCDVRGQRPVDRRVLLPDGLVGHRRGRGLRDSTAGIHANALMRWPHAYTSYVMQIIS